MGLTCLNCTTTENTTGFSTGGSSQARNCIAENNTTNWNGSWDKAWCSDDSGVTFKNAGSKDFRLDRTDVAARQRGGYLGRDRTVTRNYLFEDDGRGNERPRYIYSSVSSSSNSFSSSSSCFSSSSFSSSSFSSRSSSPSSCSSSSSFSSESFVSASNSLSSSCSSSSSSSCSSSSNS